MKTNQILRKESDVHSTCAVAVKSQKGENLSCTLATHWDLETAFLMRLSRGLPLQFTLAPSEAIRSFRNK